MTIKNWFTEKFCTEFFKQKTSLIEKTTNDTLLNFKISDFNDVNPLLSGLKIASHQTQEIFARQIRESR